MTTFREECPRDLKILIGSYLPLGKLIRLPNIGRAAVSLAWRRHPRWSRHERCVLPYLRFGPRAKQPYQLIEDRPVRISDWGALAGYTGRDQVFFYEF